MPEAVKVKEMFSDISGSYDSANHIISCGIDFFWRHKLVNLVKKLKPSKILDLATGSGDVALLLKKKIDAEVVGMDFCEPMLEQARKKKFKSHKTKNMQFLVGDCLDLPLADNSFDVVTIAFGLRNLENRDKGLKEMHRVLKKGGVLFVLEFTQPDSWFKPFYYIYIKWILPLLAKLITGNMKAYDYLAGSIEAFPTKSSLKNEIEQAGFSKVQAQGLTASIVAIHRCEV